MHALNANVTKTKTKRKKKKSNKLKTVGRHSLRRQTTQYQNKQKMNGNDKRPISAINYDFYMPPPKRARLDLRSQSNHSNHDINNNSANDSKYKSKGYNGNYNNTSSKNTAANQNRANSNNISNKISNNTNKTSKSFEECNFSRLFAPFHSMATELQLVQMTSSLADDRLCFAHFHSNLNVFCHT